MIPRRSTTRRLLALGIALAHLGVLTAPALANPQGGSLIAGAATITQGPGLTHVVQSSDRAIINWQSFSNSAGETVRFSQPSATSATLNRVTGASGSVIDGALQANGRVYLLNPNGVLFGTTARVQVGGLVASTLELRDDRFLDGRDEFRAATDRPAAAVVNRGEIQASGPVALLGGFVNNEGTIRAPGGQVVLGAGREATLALDGRSLVTVAMMAGPRDVALDADAASDLARQAVNNRDLVPAGAVEISGGRVVLRGAEGLAINQGTIDVSAAPGGAAGAARVDSAQATVLAPGAQVRANGTGFASRGGDVRLMSRGTTVFARGSRLEARGGDTGDGGALEVSGAQHVHVLGTVDVSAPGGRAGSFLIDPADLRIVNGSGPGSLDSGLGDLTVRNTDGGSLDTISEAALESITRGTIMLEATGTITLEDIDDGGSDRLELAPDVSLVLRTVSGSITFADLSNTIRAQGAGSVRVEANVSGQPNTAEVRIGNVLTDGGVVVLTNGGPGGVSAGVIDMGAGLSSPAMAGTVTAFSSTSGTSAMRVQTANPVQQARPDARFASGGALASATRVLALSGARPTMDARAAQAAPVRPVQGAQPGMQGAGTQPAGQRPVVSARGGTRTDERADQAGAALDRRAASEKGDIDRRAGEEKQQIDVAARNDRSSGGRAKAEQQKRDVDDRAGAAKRDVDNKMFSARKELEIRAIDDKSVELQQNIDRVAANEKAGVDRAAAQQKAKIDQAAQRSPRLRGEARQAKADVDAQAEAAKAEVDNQAAQARKEVADQAANAKGELAKMEKGPKEPQAEKKEESGKPALPPGAVEGKENVVPEGGLVTLAETMGEAMGAVSSESEESMELSAAMRKMRQMSLAPVTEIKAPQLRPTMSAGLAGAIGRGSTRSLLQSSAGASSRTGAR